MSVALVGAGPGDPGLITVRGLELLRSCEILVHDRLVAPELVAEAPADALRVERDALEQEQVNELLVAYGRAGFDVVRLKGGDPFVFGRGGEEALALAAADVPFEVVPGVSSIAAVPGAAGIPITHRGITTQVIVTAGHDAELDYELLARSGATLVFFMGLGRLRALADGLVEAGLPASTPAAVVSRGTLPDQRAALSTLGRIVEDARGLATPALVVVGDVVGLAPALAARPDRWLSSLDAWRELAGVDA